MSIQRAGHRYRDTETGKTVDTWFPLSSSRLFRHCLAERAGFISGDFVDVSIEDLTQPPLSTEEVWLRLHLMSQRLIKPNEVNLDGRSAGERSMDVSRSCLAGKGRRIFAMRSPLTTITSSFRPSINFPG